MQRGFKSYANRVAAETRAELGLTLYEALDCTALADDLGIPLIQFTDLHESLPRSAWDQLVHDEGAFSAMTVFTPSRTVVLNDNHHPNRQTSSLAHELAHALLMHPPLPVHRIASGNHRDSEQEAEANFLAGALLIPEEACLTLARRGVPLHTAATKYGVSPDLVEYRLGVSGARMRAHRERARRRGN